MFARFFISLFLLFSAAVSVYSGAAFAEETLEQNLSVDADDLPGLGDALEIEPLAGRRPGARPPAVKKPPSIKPKTLSPKKKTVKKTSKPKTAVQSNQAKTAAPKKDKKAGATSKKGKRSPLGKKKTNIQQNKLKNSKYSKIVLNSKAHKHIIDRHVNGNNLFGGKKAGSKFHRGADIKGLINGANNHPYAVAGNGHHVRTYDTGRSIGRIRNTGKFTSFVTVVTKPDGRVVTAYPGHP